MIFPGASPKTPRNLFLRHWFATTLLKRVVRWHVMDTRKIQVLHGHKSLSSTQVYTHMTSEEASRELFDEWDSYFLASEENTWVRIQHGLVKSERGERDSNPRSHREIA